RAKVRAARAAKPGACIPERLRFVTRHVVHTVVAVGNVAQGVRGRLERVTLRRDKADWLDAPRIEYRNEPRPQRRHGAGAANDLIGTIDANDEASVTIGIAADVRHAATGRSSGIDRFWHAHAFLISG